ncbi:hypothetical protein BH23PLA1_BH23PLA1_42820 [soil metagenome]
MGHWGVRSYEVDEAADALDLAFARVCGDAYEDLMDDRNPLTYEQVQERLASSETLVAALDVLREEFGNDPESWDEVGRLAFCGVVVRHAELGLPIPAVSRRCAIAWLQSEPIEWDEATKRELRRKKEIALLERAGHSD